MCVYIYMCVCVCLCICYLSIHLCPYIDPNLEGVPMIDTRFGEWRFDKRAYQV